MLPTSVSSSRSFDSCFRNAQVCLVASRVKLCTKSPIDFCAFPKPLQAAYSYWKIRVAHLLDS